MPMVPNSNAGQWHHAGRGEHHADDGREHDQQAHLGFGEFQKIPPADRARDGKWGVIGQARHAERVSRPAAAAVAAARARPRRVGGLRPKGAQQDHDADDQESRTGIVQCRERQRHAEVHGRDAERELQQHREQQQAAGPFQRLPRGRAASRGLPTATKLEAGDERAESMREVNRDPRRVGENAALVVDAEAAPQHEGVAVIHVRPPRVLAGRKIRAGHGRIVAAGPAAESDLQHQHGEAREGEWPQTQFAGRSAAAAPGRWTASTAGPTSRARPEGAP